MLVCRIPRAQRARGGRVKGQAQNELASRKALESTKVHFLRCLPAHLSFPENFDVIATGIGPPSEPLAQALSQVSGFACATKSRARWTGRGRADLAAHITYRDNAEKPLAFSRNALFLQVAPFHCTKLADDEPQRQQAHIRHRACGRRKFRHRARAAASSSDSCGLARVPFGGESTGVGAGPSRSQFGPQGIPGMSFPGMPDSAETTPDVGGVATHGY